MSVPHEMLLHPELLSNEQLMLIIQERHLRILDIGEMTRDQLLDIFHQYCVPYGQRKYRDSGRGRLLNRTRQVSPGPVNHDMRTNGNFHVPKSNLSQSIHSNCERLKPPPDMFSGQNKRVKIEGRTTVVHNNIYNNNKRKIHTDMMAAVTDSPPTKKDRKPITWP